MESHINIRKAELSDLNIIRQLFFDTIINVAIGDYSEEEVKVWSSGAHNVERWEMKFEEQQFFVAEFEDQIVGFTSLLGIDYIDHLYVSHLYQGKGIASQLLSYVELQAQRQGAIQLRSDVSITARPFFEKKGYAVVKRNEIQHLGQVLINFDVVKAIS